MSIYESIYEIVMLLLPILITSGYVLFLVKYGPVLAKDRYADGIKDKCPSPYGLGSVVNIRATTELTQLSQTRERGACQQPHK